MRFSSTASAFIMWPVTSHHALVPKNHTRKRRAEPSYPSRLRTQQQKEWRNVDDNNHLQMACHPSQLGPLEHANARNANIGIRD